MIEIRPVTAQDRKQWESLWRGYLHFYGTELPADVVELTFQRLLSDGHYEPRGFVALQAGAAVGLVHFLFHRHCWKTGDVIYLQDLFTAESARGTGVGRALIQAVYAVADETNAGSVYWLTEDSNQTAMQLYDKVARRTRFVKYQR